MARAYTSEGVGVRPFLIAAVAATLVSFLVLAGWNAAAADKYTFLARGIVTSVDHGSQNVTIAVNHVAWASSPTQAKADLAGNALVYKVKGSKFYKWEKGKKVPKTFTKALPSGDIGQEVVIRGAAKGSGNYNVSWLVVNDRTFSIVGKLKEHDQNKKMMRILVGTSTYKQSRYANKEVVFSYGNATKFKSQGTDVDADTIGAGNQKVKVVGEIVRSNWEIRNFFDNVK